MNRFSYLLELLGLTATAYGAYRVYSPAGYIVGGLFVFGYAQIVSGK